MTYCLAIAVDEGLVFASDSRTNAGIDQISTYGKMRTYTWHGDRALVLLSAGNLATTQAVVRAIDRDLAAGPETRSLATLPAIEDAAEYIGELSVGSQQRAAQQAGDIPTGSLEATFILGGQVGDHPPNLYLIYPQGNFIGPPTGQSFLQIGETKYGKPILDRIVAPELPLDRAATCALLSIDSTMRSNVSVGPPVDLTLLRRDRLGSVAYWSLDQDDAYFREIRDRWGAGLRRIFDELPPPPLQPESRR